MNVVESGIGWVYEWPGIVGRVRRWFAKVVHLADIRGPRVVLCSRRCFLGLGTSIFPHSTDRLAHFAIRVHPVSFACSRPTPKGRRAVHFALVLLALEFHGPNWVSAYVVGRLRPGIRRKEARTSILFELFQEAQQSPSRILAGFRRRRLLAGLDRDNITTASVKGGLRFLFCSVVLLTRVKFVQNATKSRDYLSDANVLFADPFHASHDCGVGVDRGRFQCLGLTPT